MSMKKIIFLLITIFLLTGCSSKTAHAVLVDSAGEKIIFSSLQGKWIFINYWATWCHPCMTEIPVFNQFYQAHQKQVTVLGVNYDGLSSEKLNAIIKKLNINFPVLLNNPAKILNLPDNSVVPTTYVFNPKGKLVKILLGPQTQATLAEIISP
jgi:thiol-disulfide isomerase/thioredoxin